MQWTDSRFIALKAEKLHGNVGNVELTYWDILFLIFSIRSPCVREVINVVYEHDLKIAVAETEVFINAPYTLHCV